MGAAVSNKAHWRLPAAIASCIVGLATFAAGSVVFYYQVRYSWVALAGGVDLDAASRAVPDWIRWALVDLSLVTPGLVLHVGYRLLRGSRDIFKAPSSWVPQPTFPFPRPYKAFYVNMGLLGTLVGFVVAFQDPAASLESQAAVLMESLGTAVWSSLTAVALAYGLCPVVELLAQYPFRRADTTGNPLAALSASAASTASALDRIAESAARLGHRVDLSQLQQDLASATERIASLALQIAALNTRVDAQSQQGVADKAQLVDEIRDIRSTSRESASTTRLEREVSDLRRDLASKDELGELRNQLDDLLRTQRRRREHAQRSVRGALDQLRGLVERLADDEQ